MKSKILTTLAALVTLGVLLYLLADTIVLDPYGTYIQAHESVYRP